MEKRVLMLATTAAMIEQFNKNNVQILNSLGYKVDVAGNFLKGNPISDEKLEDFKKWIENRGGNWYHIPSTRNPLNLRANIDALKEVINLINKWHYAFIHCHTPIGSVIGRIAANITCTKIIYTAHGFHFYKGAPLKNWLLYYPVEKFFSRWTDVLILINKQDYNRAKLKFRAKKVVYIPGIGVDIDGLRLIKADEISKRKELSIPKDAFVIISVGELNKNKNHKVIIDAIGKIKREMPDVADDIHYVIVGRGGLSEFLIKRAEKLGIIGNLHLLGYRADVPEVLCCADIFALPSRREGLSIAAIEAMAKGLPMITSNVHGILDYSEEGVTGHLCKPSSVMQFKNAILSLKNDLEFREKCSQIVQHVSEKFDVSITNRIMREVYEQISKC